MEQASISWKREFNSFSPDSERQLALGTFLQSLPSISITYPDDPGQYYMSAITWIDSNTMWHEGETFRIPSQGGLTLVLRDSASRIPLASGSMIMQQDEQGSFPLVVLLQKVTTMGWEQGIRAEVKHPLFDQLRKLSWQETLLGQFKQASRILGLQTLGLVSGFQNRDVGHRGYTMSLALKHYDRVAQRLNWTPMLASGVPLTAVQADTLRKVMRAVYENPGLQTLAEVKQTFQGRPEFAIPAFWQCSVSSPSV